MKSTTSRRLVTAAAVTIAVALCGPPLVVLAREAVAGGASGGVSIARLVELLVSTLVLTVLVVVITVTLGTTTALLCSRTTLRARRLWSIVVTVPLVLPAYVIAVALAGMGGGGGVVTAWLAPIGVDRLPVIEGLPAATLCLSLAGLPIVHSIVTTALARLDPAVEESARMLGDSATTAFRRAVLPALRAPLATASCLVSLYVLSDFGAVSVLRYDTFTRAIYAQFRGRVDLAPAFALCGILVVVAGGVIFLHWTLGGRRLTPSISGRPPRLVTLGPVATAASTALLALVATVSLALPVMTLIAWTVRGLTNSVAPGPIVGETVNAVAFAVAAAALTLALAVPIAAAIASRTTVGTRIAEFVPWLTHSLPQLALALAFLVLSLALPAPFYQSSVVLLLAYASVSLPVAVGALLIGWRRIGPRFAEVSRTLGRSGPDTVWRVTLPLLWRSGLTGALLVAFAVVHELPLTLLLRPTGTETLAIRIWGAVVEGQYTTASIAALALVVVSVPFVVAHERLTRVSGPAAAVPTVLLSRSAS